MTRSRGWVGLLVAVVVAGVLWWAQADGTDPSRGASSATTSTTTSTTGSTSGSPAGLDPESGLAWVAEGELPQEAANTLKLVDAGGPFPYEQDGAVFENREGHLPPADRGRYHEYTVDTPGSDDRGARRIVTGGPGEYYWTQDHYESFERIQR